MLNDWIERNYNYLKRYTNNLFHNDSKGMDTLNDCILNLYDMKIDKINSMINPEIICTKNRQDILLKYVIRMIKINSFSNTSPFYKIYKDMSYVDFYNSSIDNIIDDDNQIEEKLLNEYKLEKIEDVIYNDTIFKYKGNVRLFEMYYLEGFNCRQISELLGISYYMTKRQIEIVRTRIKNNI